MLLNSFQQVLELNFLTFALQFAYSGGTVWPCYLTMTGSSMSDGADRREARRFNMTLPMRILSVDSNSPELKAFTRDVSYRGLYFLAEAEFKLGSSIDFVITLPEQVTRGGDVNIRCHGEVVRTEPTQNGKMGIAAKIYRYEFLHAVA